MGSGYCYITFATQLIYYCYIIYQLGIGNVGRFANALPALRWEVLEEIGKGEERGGGGKERKGEAGKESKREGRVFYGVG